MSTLRTDTLQNAAGTKSVLVNTVIDGTAKAWVFFNGTGTMAIQAGFNVASITDLGTGAYAINFQNALQDIYYAPIMTTNNGGVYDAPGASTSTKTTTRLDVNTRTNAGALADVSAVHVAVFR